MVDVSEAVDVETNSAASVSETAQEKTQGGCVRVTRRDNRFFALLETVRAAPS